MDQVDLTFCDICHFDLNMTIIYPKIWHMIKPKWLISKVNFENKWTIYDNMDHQGKMDHRPKDLGPFNSLVHIVLSVHLFSNWP